MYAIVEIGGKQFRVSKDMKLRVPLLESEPGKQVGFDRILFIDDENGKTTIGNPIVNNMLVNATVIGHDRDKKVVIFKKKRRKGYQKKQGHRQGFSIIEINTIGAGSLKKETPGTKAKEVKADTAVAKTKAAAEKKPAAVKKVTTKAKETTVKPKASPAAKTKKPAAKTAAPEKAAVKKTAKSASTAKKPAAKAKKKEN